MAIKKFKIDTQKGAARIGSINVNGKSLETPFYFPVMSFFCGGNRPSDFGGGPYRMLKRDFLKGKYTKNLFQGVITSVSQFFDFGLKPKKIEYYLEKSIAKWFDYEGVVFVDSGGYKLLSEKHAPFRQSFKSDTKMRENIQRYQKGFGPDIYVPLDFPVSPVVNGNDWTTRTKFSIRSHVFSAKSKIKNSLLYAVIHGHSSKRLLNYIERLKKNLESNGLDLNVFDGFALGGLVPIKNDYRKIVEMYSEFRRIITDLGLQKKPRHVFGLSTNMLPLLTWLGADSFDSLSYLFSAIHGRYYKSGLATSNVSKETFRSCQCPICKDHKMKKWMKGIGIKYKYEMVTPLAVHNLWMLHSDLEGMKVAIKEEDEPLKDYLLRRFKGNKKLRQVVNENHQTTLE